MKYWKAFVSAILGGACIGFGGTVFLSLDNKVLGALFFTVGLFVICTFGLNLYTGKVCYIFERDKTYAINVPIIWLGNVVGTGLVALLVHLTRIAPIAEKAAAMCQTKMDDSLLSLFVLGILCNIFIYIGVEGYNTNPHEVGKYVALFFGVMVFILCGFEHCVADMFYFAMAGAWSSRSLLCLLIITAGKALGGLLLPACKRLKEKAMQ